MERRLTSYQLQPEHDKTIRFGGATNAFIEEVQIEIPLLQSTIIE